MNFSHAFSLPSPSERTWRFMTDVPAVLRCLPQCRDVQALEDGVYALDIRQKVGPFVFDARLQATVDVDPVSRVVAATGSGRDRVMGHVVHFDIRLSVDGGEDQGASAVAVDSNVRVQGPIAQLGYGLLQRQAGRTLDGFAERVRAALEGGDGRSSLPDPPADDG